MDLQPPLEPIDHVVGRDDAPWELVMYGDFECPFCIAAQPIVRRVRERAGDRLRFAFRHLPIEDRHPRARAAALAAEAAAARGRFWPMHDALYAAAGRLADADLRRAAAEAGVDADAVLAEVAADAHGARIARDVESARAGGATGTPTFFVNGRRHGTAFDAGSLLDALAERE